jgi:hypothetical protein
VGVQHERQGESLLFNFLAAQTMGWVLVHFDDLHWIHQLSRTRSCCGPSPEYLPTPSRLLKLQNNEGVFAFPQCSPSLLASLSTLLSEKASSLLFLPMYFSRLVSVLFLLAYVSVLLGNCRHRLRKVRPSTVSTTLKESFAQGNLERALESSKGQFQCLLFCLQAKRQQRSS